ncbi:MAG TPA: hypothetical protein VIV15_07475, partial [Anaerolineales bacterium]
TQFNQESQAAVSRLKEGVNPYIRYIRAEHERMEHNATVLENLRQRLSVLRGRSQAVMAHKSQTQS